jgi:hypothetical protein
MANSVDNKEDAVAVMEAIDERRARQGDAGLSSLELTVALANACHFNLLSGGLTGLLYNMDDAYQPLLQALHDIGARESLRIIALAITRVEAAKGRVGQHAKTWGDIWDAAGADELDALGEEVQSHTAEIWGSLLNFITANGERLR